MTVIKYLGQASVALLAGFLVVGCNEAPAKTSIEKPALGLMSSLPIFWQSEEALADLGEGPPKTHWALTALGRDFEVEPLDAITPVVLSALDTAILAQSRPLSGAENVALDDWVRAGGRVLIFSDPMLVGHSDFALGDPRRPIDSALLSPILARWGLEQSFEFTAQASIRTVPVGRTDVAIARAGAFSLRAPAGGAVASCELSAERILAQCAVGAGHAVVFGDATILEDREGGAQSPEVLRALLGMAREIQDSEPG